MVNMAENAVHVPFRVEMKSEPFLAFGLEVVTFFGDELLWGQLSVGPFPKAFWITEMTTGVRAAPK
jgi:hypothetical protein